MIKKNDKIFLAGHYGLIGSYFKTTEIFWDIEKSLL